VWFKFVAAAFYLYDGRFLAQKERERENMALAAAGVKSEMYANMLIVEIKFTIFLSKHTGR